MQVRLLKDTVASIAGNSAAGIVDLLYGKKNVNEFVIAKKLKLNINQTRNILYKLSEKGLISFIRKKDRKNGGWYTYFWTLDTGKSLDYSREVIIKDIKELEEKLRIRKEERFYHCPNCDVEMNEEQALLNNFSCPECGEVLVLREHGEIVKKIESEIGRKKEQLAFVEHELGKVRKEEGVKRDRKKKVEMRKKKIERAKLRAAREREKKKIKKLKIKKKLKHKKKKGKKKRI